MVVFGAEDNGELISDEHSHRTREMAIIQRDSRQRGRGDRRICVCTRAERCAFLNPVRHGPRAAHWRSRRHVSENKAYGDEIEAPGRVLQVGAECRPVQCQGKVQGSKSGSDPVTFEAVHKDGKLDFARVGILCLCFENAELRLELKAEKGMPSVVKDASEMGMREHLSTHKYKHLITAVSRYDAKKEDAVFKPTSCCFSAIPRTKRTNYLGPS